MSDVRASAQAAQNPDNLTPGEAGEMARVTAKTLANWRSLGIGPAYIKLSPGRGGRIRYSRKAVLAWLHGEQETAKC